MENDQKEKGEARWYYVTFSIFEEQGALDSNRGICLSGIFEDEFIPIGSLTQQLDKKYEGNFGIEIKDVKRISQIQYDILAKCQLQKQAARKKHMEELEKEMVKL